MDATHMRNNVQFGAQWEGDKGGTNKVDGIEDRGPIMDGSDGLFEWALGLSIQRPLDQEAETENSPCDCERSHVDVVDWKGIGHVGRDKWDRILLACGYMTCGITCGRVSLPFPFSLCLNPN